MFGAATVGGMARDDVHFVWFRKLDNRPIAATVQRSKTDDANAISGWLSIKVWCQDHRFCQGSGYAMPGAVLEIPGLPDEAQGICITLYFHRSRAKYNITPKI